MKEEIELKYRLANSDDFSKLLNHFGLRSTDRKKQTNHFFDTPLYIIKLNKMILRLRDEQDQFTMTVKDGSPYMRGSDEGHQDDTEVPKDPLVIRLESEFSVPCETGVDMLSGKLNPFTYFCEQRSRLPADEWETHDHLVQGLKSFLNEKQLFCLGSFTNYRTSTNLEINGTNVLLEMDETRFPNGEVHHEVEVELPQEMDTHLASEYFEAQFRLLDIQHFPDRGKSSRFYDIIIIEK